MDRTLTLGCCLVGTHVPFSIVISSSSAVDGLKDAIKDKKTILLKGIDACDLTLFQVSLPDEGNLAEETRRVIEGAECMKPLKRLYGLFPNEPLEGIVHIVVKLPDVDQMYAFQERETVNKLGTSLQHLQRWFVQNEVMPPPSEGKPSKFSVRQEDLRRAIFCGRPASRTHAVPPTLLSPIISQLSVDLKSCTPTAEDMDCFDFISHEMCDFWPTEHARMDTLREILNEHGFLVISPSVIGGYQTDGVKHVYNNRYKETFTSLVMQGRNEIGTDGAEPFLEAILYWLESLREIAFCLDESERINSNFPAILLLCFGSHLAVAGAVFTSVPNAQILGTIPLHFHPTDSDAISAGERFVCALRTATLALEAYYSDGMSSPVSNNVHSEFPFRNTYTDESGVFNTFVYDCPVGDDKRVFFAHLEDDPSHKLCVKFTRQYGADAHRTAWELGCAPKLYCCRVFEDGWIMVVMEDLSDIYFNMFESGSRSLNAQHLLTIEAVKELHAKGFVHGNIRDINIMIRRDDLAPVDTPTLRATLGKVVLLDFDWAGQTGLAKYPSRVNETIVHRPEGVERGGLILAKHDLLMVDLAFSTCG